MNPLTSYLYARPSICEGVGRLFDFGNTLNVYNISQTGQEADAVALYSDWLAVGASIRRASRKHRKALRHKELASPGRQEQARVKPFAKKK